MELLQNKPNPSDEATIISVTKNSPIHYKEAFIRIKDISGKEGQKINISLQEPFNEALYEHGYNASGTYIYTLVVDGREVQSKRMVFTNLK